MSTKEKSTEKCSICEKKPFQQLDDKNLCKKCFVSILERKIKKSTRNSNKLQKETKVLLFDSISEHIIKDVIKLPLNITIKKLSFFKIKSLKEINKNTQLKEFIKKNEIQKVIIPWTQDDEVELFLSNWFEDKKNELPQKFVKLFLPISDVALNTYCKLKEIQFTPTKRKELSKRIDLFEKKYPGTKNSITKSSIIFSDIIN
ncbi:hypothetical protein HN587_01170 [Candidatus Woesearchaeota archaeon]|nr:hypothetical protein [Candidatus Woesearchaeota archaeon]